MRMLILTALLLIQTLSSVPIYAQAAQVVNVPTRPGVQQRFLYIEPANAKATVVLFAGGQGNLLISDNGTIGALNGNFLIRSRQLFADQGLAVAIVDAPSDRQTPPFLGGFRQSRDHLADVKEVISWLKTKSTRPLWLVGTSRGTQSVGAIATQLNAKDGPDGIVLTSTILTDKASRPVPAMPLEKLTIPVLVVHHEHDGCDHCNFRDMSRLMEKLASNTRKELLTFTGGINRGDPCEAMAYHGFNGIEKDVVSKIAGWILQ